MQSFKISRLSLFLVWSPIWMGIFFCILEPRGTLLFLFLSVAIFLLTGRSWGEAFLNHEGFEVKYRMKENLKIKFSELEKITLRASPQTEFKFTYKNKDEVWLITNLYADTDRLNNSMIKYFTHQNKEIDKSSFDFQEVFKEKHSLGFYEQSFYPEAQS